VGFVSSILLPIRSLVPSVCVERNVSVRYVWVGVEYSTSSTLYGGHIGDIVEDQSGLGVPGFASIAVLGLGEA
jgi:hypothetical protein